MTVCVCVCVFVKFVLGTSKLQYSILVSNFLTLMVYHYGSSNFADLYMINYKVLFIKRIRQLRIAKACVLRGRVIRLWQDFVGEDQNAILIPFIESWIPLSQAKKLKRSTLCLMWIFDLVGLIHYSTNFSFVLVRYQFIFL